MQLKYRYSRGLKLNLSDPQSDGSTADGGKIVLPNGYGRAVFKMRSRSWSKFKAPGKRDEVLREHAILESRIMDMAELGEHIFYALGQQQGFSLIRLGDSELIILAQDIVFPTNLELKKWAGLMADISHDPELGDGDNEASRWEDFLRLSGVQFPDKGAQDYLIKALHSATLVGIPTSNRPGRSAAHIRLIQGFQTTLFKVLEKLQIPLNAMRFCDSAAHYMIHASGLLRHILLPDQYPGLRERYSLPYSKPRVLLIGNRAAEFAEFLTANNCDIVGAISRVGMNNIEEAIQESYYYSFELALVSAGSAAKYICSSIGARGKVALDTGQLFDVLLASGQFDHQDFKIPYYLML
mgnify:FL=1